MLHRWRMTVAGGALAGLVALAFATGTLLAQKPSPPPGPASSQPATHEPVHQMLDAMFGPGTSERLHAALGADAERLMDECMAMMAAMQQMHGAGMTDMPAMMRMMMAMSGPMPTHEQMHALIDGLMGAGFSERLHAALPDDGETLAMIEQCVAMMAMMPAMPALEGR
jgi:NAD(P)H-hydrate repair Nnr-like enzyme with NAD(P)H-hydrate epimerase domain